MAKHHLTDRAMRSLSTEKVQEDIYDSTFPAFGVRVSKTGRRTFFVRYRGSGRNRRFPLGTYPAVSLADARERARVVLGDVARELDPAADRQAHREGITFGELAAEYLERHAKVHKKSWREDARMLERELLPAFRHLKAADLRKGDVLHLLDGVLKRGAPIQANRVLGLLRKVFNWGLERDLVPFNPCAGVKPPSRERRRERVLTEGEIRQLWHAVSSESQSIRAAFRLLLLTAQRTGEVLTMRWEDIEGGLWTIPAEVTKSKRTHTVPLSTAAQNLLRDLIRSQGDPWVLSSPRRPGRPMRDTSLAHVAQRLRSQLGFEWRTHDLRRSAASHMARLGVSRFVVARVLNHADRSVTAIYDRHSYLPEMREALERWGCHLEEIVS